MRPAPLGGGRFVFVGCRSDQAMRQHAPGCPPVSIVLRPVFFSCFFPVIHCSCAGGFSLAVARTCIVVGANFPLQIDCILEKQWELWAEFGDGVKGEAAYRGGA